MAPPVLATRLSHLEGIFRGFCGKQFGTPEFERNIQRFLAEERIVEKLGETATVATGFVLMPDRTWLDLESRYRSWIGTDRRCPEDKQLPPPPPLPEFSRKRATLPAAEPVNWGGLPEYVRNVLGGPAKDAVGEGLTTIRDGVIDSASLSAHAYRNGRLVQGTGFAMGLLLLGAAAAAAATIVILAP